MAVGTCDSDLPETPPVFLAVAGDAGRGQVSPREREYAGIMLLGREHEFSKAKGRMAGVAILYPSVFRELPLVVILVAVEAPVMLQRIRQVGFMA